MSSINKPGSGLDLSSAFFLDTRDVQKPLLQPDLDGDGGVKRRRHENNTQRSGAAVERSAVS